MTYEQAFEDVYTKFKMHFYREVFGEFRDRESGLTTVDTFCMEVIFAMNRPTINEFSNYIRISQPNAAYKVNNLVRKGYLRKVQSRKDKREYFLEVTQKYLDYQDISNNFMHLVEQRMQERLSEEQLANLTETLEIISRELMPEVPAYKKKRRLRTGCRVQSAGQLYMESNTEYAVHIERPVLPTRQPGFLYFAFCFRFVDWKVQSLPDTESLPLHPL